MLLSDFPLLSKADLIFKDFSRKPSKFKYFSSLSEPWLHFVTHFWHLLIFIRIHFFHKYHQGTYQRKLIQIRPDAGDCFIRGWNVCKRRKKLRNQLSSKCGYHKLYGFLLGISKFGPPSPPTHPPTHPPGKCWTPSGSLKNDSFLWN